MICYIRCSQTLFAWHTEAKCSMTNLVNKTYAIVLTQLACKPKSVF